MPEINVGKINAETADLLALVRTSVMPGLEKAGVTVSDQQWVMTVEIRPEAIVVFVTIRVPLLVSVKVFGRAKVSEALRSRMTRAADQAEIRLMGWVKSRSQYVQWMDPDSKHWDTLMVTFVKDPAEFEE